MRAGVGIDSAQQVWVGLERAERTVPVHQGRMPPPLVPCGGRETRGVVAREQMLLRGPFAVLDIKAAANEGFLHGHGFAQHGQVDGIHVVAVDPDLAEDDIRGVVAVDLGGRRPDMLGEVAQPRGGGAVGLEDGLVAEQDGDGDGQDNGEQPMPGGGGAVGGESTADGVRGRQPRWLSGTGQRCSADVREGVRPGRLTHATDRAETRSFGVAVPLSGHRRARW